MHAETSHFGGRLLALFQRAAALTSAQAGKRCRVKIRSSLLVQFLQLKSCIQHIDTCRQRLLSCEYAFEQGSMSLGVLVGEVVLWKDIIQCCCVWAILLRTGSL
jgi:hypothetical protein